MMKGRGGDKEKYMINLYFESILKRGNVRRTWRVQKKQLISP